MPWFMFPEQAMKTIIKFGVFVMILLSLAFFSNQAKAYDVEESIGTRPLDSWGNAYGNTCANEFWGGQGNVCDAAGFTPDHNYTLSAVNGWNFQCDNDQGNTDVDYVIQVRNNGTGAILAESDPINITCTSAPPIGDYDNPEQTFIFSTPIALSNGVTYAIAIAMSGGTDSASMWYGSGTAGANISADMLSGNAPTTISMYFPGNSTASTSPNGITDPKYWGVGLVNGEIGGRINVYYSRATSTLGVIQIPYLSFVDSKIGGLGSLNVVTKSRDLYQWPGRWYIQPQYISLDQLTQVAGNIIAFDIATSSITGIPVFSSSTLFYPTSSQVQVPFGDHGDIYVPGGLYGTGSSSITSADLGCVPVYSCTFDADTGFWEGLGCPLVYAGAQVGSALFCPTGGVTDFMISAIGNVQSVPPFNAVFDIINSASSSIATSTRQDVSINLPIPGGMNITLLSSTSPIRGTGVKDALFTFWKALLYVGGAFGSIAMITKQSP